MLKLNSMEWTEEAKETLKKIPFFVRPKVKKEVEKYAKTKNVKVITQEFLLEAKKALLGKLSSSEKGYEVVGCFFKECKNALKDLSGLLEKTEELLKKYDLTEFLLKKTGGHLKAHNKFFVGFAGCPNSCSRIHIMDIGIHLFVEVTYSKEVCEGCLSCISVCEEEAIVENKGDVEFFKNKCVGCGACLKVCPTSALASEFTGYKVYVGGKLGRHPRLATLVKVCKNEEEVLELIEKALIYYKKFNTKGERLGTIIQKRGFEEVKKFLLES